MLTHQYGPPNYFRQCQHNSNDHRVIVDNADTADRLVTVENAKTTLLTALLLWTMLTQN